MFPEDGNSRFGMNWKALQVQNKGVRFFKLLTDNDIIIHNKKCENQNEAVRVKASKSMS